LAPSGRAPEDVIHFIVLGELGYCPSPTLGKSDARRVAGECGAGAVGGGKGTGIQPSPSAGETGTC
jgi:hypothetical protein